MPTIDENKIYEADEQHHEIHEKLHCNGKLCSPSVTTGGSASGNGDTCGVVAPTSADNREAEVQGITRRSGDTYGVVAPAGRLDNKKSKTQGGGHSPLRRKQNAA